MSTSETMAPDRSQGAQLASAPRQVPTSTPTALAPSPSSAFTSLVRQPDPITDCVSEIELLGPSVELFCFRFG